MKNFLILILFSTQLILVSCKKETFITGKEAQVGTSVDTLKFDTVFTSRGSVTQFFKIYNQNNQKLNISSITLSGGQSSPFKMNVDGNSGNDVNNVELEANDSIYVFVTVLIDPAASDLPFLVRDSIRIEYNGNTVQVQLQSYGQNANFIQSRLIDADETWVNNKPYVILGGVLIDSNATLIIEKGCRIFLHADAPFIVDGSLIVNGEKDDSLRVIFRGDRLDEPYKDFPGGWPGIFFRESSKNNVLNYAEIRNAYQGIVADKPSVNSNPKVILNECIIDNCYDAGVLGIRTNIKAQNCLVSNCGKNIILAFGGIYEFTHCTDVAISNNFIVHKEPVLLLTNFITQNNVAITADLTASFINCIFWSENSAVDDEVIVSRKGNTVFNVLFQNSLWKVKNIPVQVTATNMIPIEPPVFDTVSTQNRLYNFRLKAGSPALNKGISTSIGIDLDGLPRNVNGPDLGAYEKQ